LQSKALYLFNGEANRHYIKIYISYRDIRLSIHLQLLSRTVLFLILVCGKMMSSIGKFYQSAYGSSA